MSTYYVAALIITVAVLGLYLYAKRLKALSVKILILIPALVFGFFMYLVGYIPELLTPVDTSVTVGYEKFFVGIVRTMVSTASMMAGKADFEAIKAGSKVFLTAGFMIPFYAAHFLAFAVTIMAAVSVFGRRAMSLLKRLRWSRSDTYVIFGVNARSLALAESIMKKDAPTGLPGMKAASRGFADTVSRRFTPGKHRFVIFVDESADPSAKERIHRMGAIILTEPIFMDGALHPAALRKAGLTRSRYRKTFVFAMTGSDMTNCGIADGVWTAACKNGISASQLRGIYVYTGSRTVVEALEAKRVRLEQAYRQRLEELVEKSFPDALKSASYAQKTGESEKIRILEQVTAEHPAQLRRGADALLRELNYRYSISSFCAEELAARQLFTRLPPYKRLTFDAQTGLATSPPGKPLPAITVFVLGFGATGRSVFEQALMRSQFENCAFRAVIVDKNLGDIEGRISQDYPALFDKSCANDIVIEFCPQDVGQIALYEKLFKLIRKKDGECDIDYIVSCLGDADMNLETLTNIKNFLIKNHVSPDKLPVLAGHSTGGAYERIGVEHDQLGGITLFGNYEAVFSREIVVHETLDAMARAVHGFYDTSGTTPWELLPLHLKNSNRAAASYIDAYLHILKLRLVPESALEPPVPEGMTAEAFEAAVVRQPLLENLARTEHLRWNAFHFAGGWTKRPMDEVTGWESRKDDLTKRQVCLVRWDALSDLSWIGDFKESDRQNIRNIARIVAAYNSTAPLGRRLIMLP